MDKFSAQNTAARERTLMPVHAGLRLTMPENIRSNMNVPVAAGVRLNVHVCARCCPFVPSFASIVLQFVRWCSGGIRLLAMQETGGQLLAKKEGSRALFVSPIEGVRA